MQFKILRHRWHGRYSLFLRDTQNNKTVAIVSVSLDGQYLSSTIFQTDRTAEALEHVQKSRSKFKHILLKVLSEAL
jgi:hypothetical protein